jgi:hypothetical protein
LPHRFWGSRSDSLFYDQRERIALSLPFAMSDEARKVGRQRLKANK